MRRVKRSNSKVATVSISDFNRRGWLLVAALTLALVVPAAAQPKPTEAAIVADGGKRLGAADYDARYVGNTLSGKTAEGDAFDVFVESKTQYRMRFQGKTTTDRWAVGKDGEFCTTDGADTLCTREYLLRDEIFSFNPDGTLAGSARLSPGNSTKL
jgi:hypothetical protein